MTIANIMSAIGNNSSIYPLLVRDCGIENVAKVALTYKENNKESAKMARLAARERFLQEYSNSAVWLGGIPVISKLADVLIRKAGFGPEVNIALFKEDAVQGIARNIEKFKTKAPEAVADLVKAQSKRGAFERIAAGKFAATTFIPMALMGWVFPKIIFDSTAKKLCGQKTIQTPQQVKNEIANFKGNISFGGAASWLANRSNLQRMFIMDGGYAAGCTSMERTKEARMELGFKYLGMMFLNFIAPGFVIEPLLNKMTGTYLDPVMLADKEFLQAVKSKSLPLPKSADAKDLVDFVDDNGSSLFTKFAAKTGKITLLKDTDIRDPRAFVDTKKLGKFYDKIAEFTKTADAPDFDKIVKRMKGAKYFNILANIGLSSFLLAYCLPKAQFAFRKAVTGSCLEPGIAGTAEKKGIAVA